MSEFGCQTPNVQNVAYSHIGLLERIRIWRRRSHERQMLMIMSDRLLRDIGITRHDALCEARKPFWRA
jgi:uncharacterized protein YjiS (DUF1127 family)